MVLPRVGWGMGQQKTPAEQGSRGVCAQTGLDRALRYTTIPARQRGDTNSTSRAGLSLGGILSKTALQRKGERRRHRRRRSRWPLMVSRREPLRAFVVDRDVALRNGLDPAGWYVNARRPDRLGQCIERVGQVAERTVVAYIKNQVSGIEVQAAGLSS